LHFPLYRSKYEQNLKRELPRLPYYKDFWQWVKWGERLIDLHLNYEQQKPFPLQREDKNPETIRKVIEPRLMARQETGVIEIDTLTTEQEEYLSSWRLGT